MNKDELAKELKITQKQVVELKKNNDFLIKQQKNLRGLAEKSGSELAPYKAMFIRLKEELEKIEGGK